MIWVVLILVVVALVSGGIVLLSRHARTTEITELQLVPGQPTDAPRSWARGHDPEARLHRRMRDALRALRAANFGDGPRIDARVRLELAATELDNRLIAIAALPSAPKIRALADAERAVVGLETSAEALLTNSPRALESTDAAIRELEQHPDGL